MLHIVGILTSETLTEGVGESVADVAATATASEVSTIGAIYMIAVLMFIVILYSRGKKKYTPLCEALDKKEYPFKSLTMIGFSLMEITKYSYRSNLDRKLRKSLRELKEEEYVEFYLRTTWATAATYFIIGLFFSAMLALASIEIAVVLAVLGFGLLLAYSAIYEIDKKVAERHLEIVLDLPDFTNKLLILSGAGLSLKAAMVKVSKEMEKDTAFYRELKHSIYRMEHGSTVEAAMDTLCAKCNMPEVRRLSAVLLQNMHSGGADVLIAMNEISRELWNNRRAAAKRVAEQAGTKLLFPMMLMLLAVIVIVAAPAVMSMGV